MVGISSIPTKDYIFERLKHCSHCDRFGHLPSICTGIFCQKCGDISGKCLCYSSDSLQPVDPTPSRHEPCILGRSLSILTCLACSATRHRTTNCPGLRRCLFCQHMGHRARMPNLCYRLPKVCWTHIRLHATPSIEILPRKLPLYSMADNPAEVGMARTNRDMQVHKVWVRKRNISCLSNVAPSHCVSI